MEISSGWYRVLETGFDMIPRAVARCKITNNPKTIKFEFPRQPRPAFLYGDMTEFVYRKGSQANDKYYTRVIKKQGCGHAIRIYDDEFVLYPYESGIPYIFEKEECK